ncbi:MAG TPA: GNAT family N-acetyltransferase [Kofleriaceae bacterium]|nr:GNAT family N-acetyltransferase [Kofleriaceae bacterium]
MPACSSSAAPAKVTLPTRELSTTVVHTPQALERHVVAWHDLVANAAEPNPFYEPHALLPAWRELAATEVRVVLVWAPSSLPGQPPVLVGLFPIVRTHCKGLPLPALATWKHLYSYLATPLVRADLASEAIAALFAWLRRDTTAAVFEWQTLGADGPFYHALIDALHHLGFEAFHERSHTRALFRPAATAEAYLARALCGKKRKELRRQERRLAEAGRIVYDELAPGGDLEAWLDEFVALEQHGWKGQGGTALRTDPAGLAMFRAMARGAFARGRWMTLALRLDGRAIAMKCNLRSGTGAVAYKIAYDETYARYSPGVLLELEHIRRLHEPGAPTWMDSGAAPDHPMIDHLWRDRRAIETIVVPTGRPLGALAVAAMPLARWTSHVLRDAAQHIRSRARH